MDIETVKEDTEIKAKYMANVDNLNFSGEGMATDEKTLTGNERGHILLFAESLMSQDLSGFDLNAAKNKLAEILLEKGHSKVFASRHLDIIIAHANQAREELGYSEMPGQGQSATR